MNDNYAITALNLTIDELQTQLKDTLNTKNVLAIQLTEQQQSNKQLAQKVAELEALLDQQTQPNETEEGE